MKIIHDQKKERILIEIHERTIERNKPISILKVDNCKYSNLENGEKLVVKKSAMPVVV